MDDPCRGPRARIDRWGTALVCALVVAVSASPAAGAEKQATAYRVSFSGSGSYDYRYGDSTANGVLTQRATATLRWDARYSRFFAARGPFAADAGPRSEGGGTWSYATAASYLDDPQSSFSCSNPGSLAYDPIGTGWVEGKLTKKALRLRVLAGFMGSVDRSDQSSPCHVGETFVYDWIQGISQVGAADKIQPLAAWVTIPAKELRRQRKTVIDVTNSTPEAPSLQIEADCAYGAEGVTCAQSFGWSGTVTVVRGRTRR
jgi:hypothetical protein